MAEYLLRVLHISDLHERVALDWMDEERKAKIRLHAAARHRVLETNFLDILREVQASGRVDLVCFSGDVADWGLREEYEAAAARIDAVLQAVHVPPERLFLVPGNHDVNRKAAPRIWKKMRRFEPALRPGLSALMAGGECPSWARRSWRDDILKRTEAFCRWVREDLGRAALDPQAGPHRRLGYRATLQDLGLPFPVHVIGLDSAWLCGNDHDAGKLLLTAGQVDLLTTDSAGRPLDGFRLALVHHPLTDLADGADCRRKLADTVDLLLRGHQHEPVAEEHHDPDRDLRTLAAGSLYEGDEGDRWINAFHVVDVRVDEAGRPLCYDVTFWGWSRRGHWHLTEEFYEAAKGGRLHWPTRLGEARTACLERAAVDPHTRARDLFVGRERELEDLHRILLADGEDGRRVAITALEGMPGVGKSYLAARFAHLHAGSFPGGVHTLALEREALRTPDTIRDDLCERLDVRAPDGPQRWAMLAERLRLPPCLLIVENVDGPDEARAAAELTARLPACRLIVTGRYTGLGRSAGWGRIAVRPFEPGEALAQLTTEFREPTDPQEAEQFRGLVRRLGYLPLAIHLAAGYLAVPGRTCEGFDRMLADRGLDVGPDDPADPIHADRARSVLKLTFELSLDTLADCLDEDAGRLVPAFQCLGHAPLCGFGRSLGAAVCGTDEGDFETLAVAACRLSLLEHEKAPGGRDRFRLHPLVSELLRTDCEEQAVLRRITEWFVQRLRPDPATDEGSVAWRELHAEADAMLDWLRRVPDNDLREVERAGSVFAQRNGPYLAWAALCERGLAAGGDPVEASNFLWTLANVAREAGDMDRARSAAERKLRVDTQRGAEREAALAHGLLADILQQRGETDEALRIRREEELPVYERLGDVRSRAVTMGRIADILQQRGETDEALRILTQEELPAVRALQDADSLAHTLFSCARIRLGRGGLKKGEAQAIHEELAESFALTRKLQRVEAIAAVGSLFGEVLGALGQTSEALAVLRESAAAFEQMGQHNAADQVRKVLDAIREGGSGRE